MPSITLRPFENQDYQAVRDIYERTSPPGMQPPSAEAADTQRYVAVETQTGQLVGFGAAPLRERSSLELLVSPRRQRQGIGRLLWERLEQDLTQINAVAVEPWVREENTPAIAWLQKQGFAPTKQDGPVQIAPAEADLSAFASRREQAAGQGIVLTTLAQERKQDADCLKKLHALYNKVNADVPGSEDYSAQTLEEFARDLEGPEALPEGYFIARHGQNYVGLSYVQPRPADPNCRESLLLQQLLTGVLPEYRRRGIALALKVETIRYAREQGYRRLVTNSSNPAMCALNAKLGFRSGPWRVYLKRLR